MKLEIIFSSVVLIILIAMSITSMDYPPRARLFPLILIIFTTILVGVQIVRQLWKKFRQKEAQAEKEITHPVGFARYFRTPAWLVTFLLLIYFFGFYVGIGLFSLLYLKLNGLKWLITILFTLGMILFMYGCFQLALKIPLYEGILFG